MHEHCDKEYRTRYVNVACISWKKVGGWRLCLHGLAMGSKDYMEMKFAFLKELVIFCVRALTDTLYKLRPNYTGRKATEGYVAPNGYGFRVLLGCGPLNGKFQAQL